MYLYLVQWIIFKKISIKVFPIGLYCTIKDMPVFSWGCSIKWMSLCDATVFLDVSGCCCTSLKAFLIVSLAVEVKEAQVLMVGPTVCCVLWTIVNSICSVPRLSSLLWMLPYIVLATFLTIVRQEEVRLHAAACYCIFHLNISSKCLCFCVGFGLFFWEVLLLWTSLCIHLIYQILALKKHCLMSQWWREMCCHSWI